MEEGEERFGEETIKSPGHFCRKLFLFLKMPKGKMIKIAPPALLDRRKCKIYYVYKLFQPVQTCIHAHAAYAQKHLTY